jgi:hypothetical protein
MSATFEPPWVTLLVWEHLCWGADGVGLEHLRLRSDDGDGVIAWVDEEGRPFRLAYSIEWSPNWIFRRIRIDLTADTPGTLELTRSADGRWERNGVAARELDGCDEVDLWPTPFTNSLPIRRLRLAPGATAAITVAHVIAPELTVTPRPQRYGNLGSGIYRFESLHDGFTADLVTDDSGFVVDYPGLFRRRARVGATTYSG